MPKVSFPGDFLWGTATASYQIEGAVGEDGRGETIWDRFSHTPGNVYSNQTGDSACDHYHRYREDVQLMKELGLRSYRFSIAWSRIFPSGGGQRNAAGLDFYQRLTDELLAADIVPMVTLYHWDLPQALEDRGGWRNRDTVKYYVDYAATMFEKLGDRVKLWITHNEPWVVSYIGHKTGEHAPGLQDAQAAVQVSHHLLLSHALCVQTYRDIKGNGGKIGITLNLAPAYPETDSPEDERAARYYDGYQNRWFLDPVFKGEYPRDMLEIYKQRYDRPELATDDLEALRSGTVDFLGVNYYMRALVRRPADPEELFGHVKPDYHGVHLTEMGWEVYAPGLYDLLVRLQKDYDSPELYVTENGIACRDDTFAAETIQDDDRISYLEEHFRAAHRAMQEGVNLRGYQVWSLIDNFEWAHGYSKRFGIVHIDYKTQKRTLKKSAYWYRDLIADNSL